MALVNYSSSSSDASGDGEDDINPPKKKRLLLLPKAITQIGTRKTNLANKESEYDDPVKHGGRIRTFKHERGNWATYIYIPVSCSVLEDIQEQSQQKLHDLVELHEINDLHISLSRTFVLQFHLIDSFVQSLGDAFATSAGFRATLQRIKIYTNEEKTRTFMAFQVDEMYFAKFHKLMTQLDVVLSEYRLPKFYEDPSFHISFLWCLGDKVELLNAHLDRIKETLLDINETANFNILVKELHCKSGNKSFSLKLK